MNAETDTDTTLTQSLPLASIVVAPDHNPRKHFNTAEFDRLVESIRENGLLTPVLVRPNPNGDGYELIAGERRLRAMRALGADTIPALIKDLDDSDAARAALIENLDRSALSVAEESLAAQSHVSAYDGDYEAAAKALGWGVQKLRHRLRLLHCAPEVMRSLMEEQITLGHAELLATVPVENQLKALPRVLANNIGVAELREQLNGFATPLAQAIFDQAVSGCATCEFNSATQRSLFSTHLDDGMCTNRACFTGHTQTALQAKKEKLKEDFGTVALHSERVPGSTIPLVVHGDSGVGAEQFSVCRGCQFRGAVIQDAVGPQTGKVDHPLCFNRACHSSKVEAHQQSLKPVVEASDAQPSRPDTAPASGTTKGTAMSKPNPGASKTSPAKPAAAKATPGAVADQYAAILRRAVTARLQTDPVSVLSLALYALLRVTGDEVTRHGIEPVVKALGLPVSKTRNSTGKQNVVPMALLTLDKPALQQAIVAASLHLLEANADETESVFNGKLHRRALVASLAEHHALDLQPYVQITTEFLAAHTKAGIEQILDESGFSAWLTAQEGGEKRLKALLGSGKADLVKGVLEASYPGFASYLPSGLAAQAAAWRKMG